MNVPRVSRVGVLAAVTVAGVVSVVAGVWLWLGVPAALIVAGLAAVAAGLFVDAG